MNVTLISYTGHGHPDPLYAARLLAYTKNTRLEQGAETRRKFDKMTDEDLLKELDYIANTIRSSWEFVDYTFEIRGVTRAFTHQFVRTRTGSYAQQSQRSVALKKIDTMIPETVRADPSALAAWMSCVDSIAEVYEALGERGIPAQDARGLLPTNIHTNIIAKFNLRTLADLFAKRKNLRAQGEYADVARLMEHQVLQVHPWAEPFLNPQRTRTPALDKLLKDALGTSSPIDKPMINAALKELDSLKGTWG